jgi:hypothetical protein
VRVERGRTKKLIVAFHFQFANQAGWKCDTCRAQGLEKKRGCGFQELEGIVASGIVWARRNAAAPSCPRSYITAASLEMLERFRALKAFGGSVSMDWPAREVDALCLLENELRAEIRNEQR